MPFYTEHSGDSFTLPRVDLNPLQDKVPQAESPFVQVWTPCSLSYLPSVWRTHRTRYVHPRWYTVVDAGGTVSSQVVLGRPVISTLETFQ